MGSVWTSIQRWLRKEPSEAVPEVTREKISDGPEQPDVNQALQGFGSVLRTWGEQAFDIDELDAVAALERFEAWAKHVAEGAPPPAGGRGAAGFRRGSRDWRNLKSFVTEHRTSEKKFVTKNIKELKDALWTFVQRLSKTFAADKDADAKVAEQLGHLKSAAAKDSLQELKKAVLTSVEVIERSVAERQARAQEEMEEACHRLQATKEELTKAKRELALDPLTKLYNRAAFDEHLRVTCALNNLSRKPACLLMIDADNFKQLNDEHGHPAGDEMLRSLSRLLLKIFLRKHDFVARYGGEEFAVVLPRDETEIGLGLAQKLLEIVRANRVSHQGKTLSITVSIGLASLAPGEDPLHWLERADQALLAAKQAGRDRCLKFEDVTTPV